MTVFINMCIGIAVACFLFFALGAIACCMLSSKISQEETEYIKFKNSK